MKTFKVALLVAVLACVPAIVLFAADSGKMGEMSMKGGTIEELLAKLNAGPNQTEAFDMFLAKFKPLVPEIDKVMVEYMHYGLQDGLALNFEPVVRPDIVVVPLGPAIMAQMNLKGGVLVDAISGDMLKSTLMQYDIVTSVGGTQITDVASFNKALMACKPDMPTEFQIIRGGKAMPVKGIVPPMPLAPMTPKMP